MTNPTGFRSALALFDADNTSSNDELFTVEGDRQPEIHFDYADGVVRLRAAGDASYVPELWTASYPTLGVPYTENFSFCTRAEQPLLCLRVTVEEVAP